MTNARDAAKAIGIGTEETARVFRAIVDRDAEHRAELAAAQATIEQLGKDAAAMAAKLDRAMNALAVTGNWWREEYAELSDLAAPPPAESTPVQCDQPDDIRERLRDCETEVNKALVFDIAATKALQDHERRLAALDEFVHRLAQDSATQGVVVTLENKVAALEANGSDRCARADCGRPRRWGGHGGHHVFVSALEAKGEPGTHAFEPYPTIDGGVLCDGCGKPDGPPYHPKGAKP